jgi:hypothetical protein
LQWMDKAHLSASEQAGVKSEIRNTKLETNSVMSGLKIARFADEKK